MEATYLTVSFGMLTISYKGNPANPSQRQAQKVKIAANSESCKTWIQLLINKYKLRT